MVLSLVPELPSCCCVPGAMGSAMGIERPGDKTKKDSLSVTVGFRVGRVCCCFPLPLELAFLTEEKWSVVAT